MDIKEKASYILGLIEGSKIDTSKEENRIIVSVAELLRDIASKVEELSKVCSENTALIDEIDEDLASLEKSSCAHNDGSCKKNMLNSGDCDCDVKANETKEGFLDDGSYEICCPSCKRVIVLNDEIFEKEDILCPECGEKINFDYKDVDED